MKILTFDKPNANAVPVELPPMYIDEDTNGQPAMMITVPHYFAQRKDWVSHVQVSNNYITVSKFGSPTVGFHVDDLVRMLFEKFPEIQWPPVFLKQPQSVRINEGETAVISVQVNSFGPVKFQWQQFDGKDWQNCPGFTEATFQVKAAAIYRCMATNERTTTVSEKFSVTFNPPEKASQ